MAPAQNHLLSQLPPLVRSRILALSHSVALNLTEVLYPGGQAIDYVYFPLSGFISLVTLIDKKPAIEVGMVGSEGLLGARLALGVKVEPLRAVVQGAGVAWRLRRIDFIKELARNVSFKRLVLRYLNATMTQVTTSAACTRFHGISPRLARWLLMTHDRAHADSFRVTHEFLAYMLGVRRGGITIAASALQSRGVITYHRGQLTVLNRRRLEAAACSCYLADRRAFTSVSH